MRNKGRKEVRARKGGELERRKGKMESEKCKRELSE